MIDSLVLYRVCLARCNSAAISTHTHTAAYNTVPRSTVSTFNYLYREHRSCRKPSHNSEHRVSRVVHNSKSWWQISHRVLRHIFGNSWDKQHWSTLSLSKMNTRPLIENSRNPTALSASFNHDASCFAVGLDTGFRGMSQKSVLFEELPNYKLQCSTPKHANNELPEVGLKPQFLDWSVLTTEVDFNGGVGTAQMLGNTNYIALVGGGKQPKFAQNKASRFKRGGLIHVCVLTLL